MTGEKYHQESLNPVTYTLTQSFSYTSDGTGHTPPNPIAPYVLIIYLFLTCGVQDQSLPIKPIHHLPSHYYIRTYIMPKQYSRGSVLREV